MKRSTLLWTLVFVVALSLLGVAATYAQGGQASLVVINYVGSQMIFTLDGTQYTVPGTDSAPGGGQLTLALGVGRHEYSGTIPGGPGSNGQVELAAGQTYVLGALLETIPARVSSEGVVLEKPRDRLVFFEASLNPPASPSPVTRPALQALPAGQGALVLDNYISEELVVDIKGTVYRVPANGRLQVNLAPGEYAYSASAGVSGINGFAQVKAGEYTGLGFSREPVPTPTYETGEPVPTRVSPKIIVSIVPLGG